MAGGIKNEHLQPLNYHKREITMEKYTLGLDIGIGSVGWAVIDQEKAKLIEMGVRIFEEGEPASNPRTKRSARRTLRRKQWRQKQLLNAFEDFGIIDKQEIEQPDYLSYTVTKGDLKRPKDSSVYHLRKRAINEKVTKRELLLCLYSICKTRGHFLLETVDFNKDGITEQVFFDKFYEFLDRYGVELAEDRTELENKLLRSVFSGKIKANDIKTAVKNCRFTADADKYDDMLDAAVRIVSGFKGKAFLFDESLGNGTKSAEDLKKSGVSNELFDSLIELYDLCKVAQILSEGNNYICEVAVKKLDALTQAQISGNKEYEAEVAKSNKSAKHRRAVKNLDNNYPNGLYVKEASAILHEQQKYYPEITDSFIEVVCSIISARIPYYIGPLAEDAKNAWLIKENNFKYSYQYSIQNLHSVNEFESIKEWKKRMISHCTYLPEEEALPKGSFLAETFSILNELNIYRCKDNTENDYYLKKEDKVSAFDNLFLKKREGVTFGELKDLLDLSEYGPKNGKTKKFNNKYTLYFDIISILPELKLNSILDIYNEREKIEKLEKIILDINLFDEEKSKEEYFSDPRYGYGYTEDVAKKLAKLKSKSFFSFSRKFIFEQGFNEQGETMIDILFDDNSEKRTNEQMTIITEAVDKNGEPLDFRSNKYISKLKENKELGIELLLDNGKPVIPVSRATIRSLNECLKMYKAIVKLYGIPERVVVETARGEDSIKDFTTENGSPEKHFDKVEKLYDYLLKQLKETESNYIFRSNIEQKETILESYEKHKDAIELYIRQNGIDLLTGKPIRLNNLNDYQIDHILPRGFGDDSMDDKMLISRKANALKGNRTPIEFLESSDADPKEYVTTGRFKTMVGALYEMKLISDKKHERLMLENQEDLEKFINRNLVDTRYIIREFMSILNAYNEVNGYDSHIVALKAAFTSTFRKAFNLRKDRDLGDQHHAIDAATVAMADKLLSTYYPNYDRRGDFKAYQNFISGIVSHDQGVDEKKKKEDQTKRTILSAYYRAYGQDHKLAGSLLSQVKETVPLYSHKVEKNWKGAFFEATIQHKGKESKTAPLSVLGINKDIHSFSGVECAAVDFYKVATPKGRKHIAIHIPKAIISEGGVINKMQYLTLVKDYYKCPELIDEKGELNTRCFRFRAFRNDIVYDTNSNVAQLFNLGSIAIKKLELKQVQNFSYNQIYCVANDVRSKIVDHFKLKSRDNPQGFYFSDLDNNEVIDWIIDNYLPLPDEEKRKTIKKSLEKCNNIHDFSNRLVFLTEIGNRKNTPPTIIGQYLPTVHNREIAKNENAYYVKLKYSPLGLRFSNSEKGKLIVTGPKKDPGSYSKIVREEFSWKISKYSV